MTIQPAPKPAAREKKERKPVKRQNKKRLAKRFLSDFGGPEYLALVQSLPCAICGVQGYTVAAHLTSRGAGGKADEVAPLCGAHMQSDYYNCYLAFGCHEKYDLREPAMLKHEPRLRREARARWQSWSGLPSTPAKR